MPAVYDKLGIRFLYPENWQLDETDMIEGNNSVTVYGPDGTFWTILAHPAGLEQQDLIEAALEAMHEEYTDLDEEPYHDVVGGKEVWGADLNFYCLDLTNTAWLRSYATDEGTYLVLCQGEDRAFERVAGVFDGMLQSLLAPSAECKKLVDDAAQMAGEVIDE
ncbi:MAG: hypothetical protein JSS27_14955 [Planctomycetes bacterium]|nr:hypothetical protein [Planctomycetota bacterium]